MSFLLFWNVLWFEFIYMDIHAYISISKRAIDEADRIQQRSDVGLGNETHFAEIILARVAWLCPATYPNAVTDHTVAYLNCITSFAHLDQLNLIWGTYRTYGQLGLTSSSSFGLERVAKQLSVAKRFKILTFSYYFLATTTNTMMFYFFFITGLGKIQYNWSSTLPLDHGMH